jgi:hypothetical protein
MLGGGDRSLMIPWAYLGYIPLDQHSRDDTQQRTTLQFDQRTVRDRPTRGTRGCCRRRPGSP